MLGSDHAAVAQGIGPLENVLEFPHISGKGVGGQGPLGAVIETRRDVTGNLAQDVFDQLRQVLAPLAQRRNAQLDDVDAIIEILPKLSGLQHVMQGFMSGREQADIDRYLATFPDRTDRPFLNRAQQLDLHGQGQLGDLVQKQGAAARGPEHAGMVIHGAGETALPVTEQFTFHQLGRQGPAVHGNEGFLVSIALGMDEPRDQLLARPRFAADVDGRLAAGHLGNHAAQPAHGLRIAQQDMTSPPLGPCRAGFDGGGDEPAQHVEIDGLGDEIIGTGLEGFDGRFHIPMGRDYRHGQVHPHGGDFANQIDSIAIGKPHVGEA